MQQIQTLIHKKKLSMRGNTLILNNDGMYQYFPSTERYKHFLKSYLPPREETETVSDHSDGEYDNTYPSFHSPDRILPDSQASYTEPLMQIMVFSTQPSYDQLGENHWDNPIFPFGVQDVAPRVMLPFVHMVGMYEDRHVDGIVTFTFKNVLDAARQCKMNPYTFMFVAASIGHDRLVNQGRTTPMGFDSLARALAMMRDWTHSHLLTQLQAGDPQGVICPPSTDPMIFVFTGCDTAYEQYFKMCMIQDVLSSYTTEYEDFIANYMLVYYLYKQVTKRGGTYHSNCVHLRREFSPFGTNWASVAEHELLEYQVSRYRNDILQERQNASDDTADDDVITTFNQASIDAFRRRTYAD